MDDEDSMIDDLEKFNPVLKIILITRIRSLMEKEDEEDFYIDFTNTSNESKALLNLLLKDKICDS